VLILQGGIVGALRRPVKKYGRFEQCVRILLRSDMDLLKISGCSSALLAIIADNPARIANLILANDHPTG
jgi:hypothetical protein